MVTFILPGYSLHNKSWADEAAAKLKLEHEVRPVYWTHWDDPSHSFDPKEKVRLIVDTARQNQINILAKSIGTLVALYIMEKAPDRIERIILCGIPLNEATLINEQTKEVYRKILTDVSPEKIVCFQNVEDPLGSYEEVRMFLEKINPKIKVVGRDRSDHEYPYYEDFREFLLQGTVKD